MWKASLFIAVLALYLLWSWDSFDPATLSGKRILITGASSGIGEHLAYEYSKLRARVVIAARRVDRLKKVAQKCLELGARQAEVVVADMAKVEDRDRLVQDVERLFGGLDVLILNHAVSSPGWWQGTVHMDIFKRHFEINFVSYVDLTAKTLPLLTQSGGSVGIVSSVAGKIPTPGTTVYSATKFALQGFFHSLRQEFLLRDIGVSVTLAVLGPVDTDIVARTQEEKRKMKDTFGLLLTLSEECPQDAALAILQGVAEKKSEIYFGKVAYALVFIDQLLPWLSPPLSRRFATLVTSATSFP